GDARSYANTEETYNLAKELADGSEIIESFYVDSISRSREQYYLDSMSNQVIFNILVRKYTYKDCKEREINLGLDLKGGMNVTMEISVVDIVKALSGYTEDPTFNEAIKLALEKKKSSQKDFVTLFGESFTEVDPNAKLAAIFTTIELKDKVNARSTNEEVLQVLYDETNGAIDRSFNILRTRIDRFGVAQPNIQKLQSAGRILVELPGIKEPERVRKLLQGSAKLEFWETYEFSELSSFFGEANKKLVSILGKEEILEQDELTTIEDSVSGFEEVLADDAESVTEANIEAESTVEDTVKESTLLEQLSDTSGLDETSPEDQSFEDYAKNNPLYAYLSPAYVQDEQGQYFPAEGATVGYAQIKDTAKVNRMLWLSNNVFPRNVIFMWTVKPDPKRPDILELVAIKITSRDRRAPIEGDVVVDARQDYDQNGRVEITMSMNAEGAMMWKRLTANNVDRHVAIVLDGYVYSHPRVNEEIPSGRTSISGNFSVEEAKDLANILKAGKLPAPARIVEEAVVGPSLGKEAINAGLSSFIIAFLLVLLYMILYYNRAGWVADLALVTNIFFLFGVLASLQAVLTLPGIAGIVLTLGMAVDANVIIFERIKEEVRAGKGMRLAISDGYKNAYSAIIDGNVTTLLTGIVLYTFGSGPVQGFATTLIIGILSSLFSALFISRLIFTWFLNTNRTINFANKRTKDFLANVNFNFLARRKTGYIISSIIIILGIVSLTTRGLNFGVDFSGGRTYVIRFDQDVKTNELRSVLTAEFDNTPTEVKTFGPNKQVKITTKYMIEDKSEKVDSIIETKLYIGLKPFFSNQDIDFKDFAADTETGEQLIGILSSQKVGPTIAHDIKRNAALAMIIALIVIFLYIAARFRKWQFGLGGVAALFHYSLITISLFSMFYNILPFSMEIDQAFIAAILTIIGYSINDTVIIFDRIREYTGLYPKKDLKTNINDALNSTLARTINTSGTTLTVLFIIFIFGGEIIRGFTFALLVGILVGTYSSLFTASPIAYDLTKVKAVVSKIQNKRRK
ncbi:MAG: protein translocase subunit SecDF, partial [Bacteroidales bacterium]|nr:protein translocase subunit SecDF [Bacteroidales bacterium]